VRISSKNFERFCTVSHVVLSCMRKWFATKKMALYKTNIMEFVSSNPPQYRKYVEEAVNTKLSGLQINNHRNWKCHVDRVYELR
jgi:hypothetical protein